MNHIVFPDRKPHGITWRNDAGKKKKKRRKKAMHRNLERWHLLSIFYLSRDASTGSPVETIRSIGVAPRAKDRVRACYDGNVFLLKKKKNGLRRKNLPDTTSASFGPQVWTFPIADRDVFFFFLASYFTVRHSVRSLTEHYRKHRALNTQTAHLTHTARPDN